MATHTLSDWCSKEWCRLHWWPAWKGHETYPLEVNVPLPAPDNAWRQVVVHCGPGAFNIKQAKKEDQVMKTWSLPAEPNRNVTRVRGASGHIYRRDHGSSFWRPILKRNAPEWRWGTLLANDGPVTEEP